MEDDDAPAGPIDQMRAQLMEMSLVLEPVYEWGEGQKSVLLARGWSAVAADSIAATLVKAMLVRQLTTRGR